VVRFRVEIVKIIYVRGAVNSKIGFQFHMDNPQNLTVYTTKISIIFNSKTAENEKTKKYMGKHILTFLIDVKRLQ
jgi:hypothetical protein